MAGPGITTVVTGARDDFGGTFFNVADHTGVASYVGTTGELLDPKSFGFAGFVTVLNPGMSVSGTYYAMVQPTGPGFTSWHVRWFVTATGVEVANAFDLSAEKVKITALGQ